MLIAILIFTIFNFINFCALSGLFMWALIDDLKKAKEKRAAQITAREVVNKEEEQK